VRRRVDGGAADRDVVSPAPRSEWHDILRSDPGATALQTPEYFGAVLEATHGQDVSRLYRLPEGRRLVLPLVRRRLLPGLKLDAGYPGGYGHGSLLATGGLRAQDVRTVIESLRGTALSIRIGGGHHTADQWSAARMPGVVEMSRRVEVIDTSGGFERLRTEGFNRNVQRSIRKAIRAGVQVERDTTGRLVPEFYQMYLAWVERWIPRSGLPPALARYSALHQEPLAKFTIVTAAMGEMCRVFVARHEGRVVASGITFVHGQHGIGWRAYSIKELAHPVAANTYLQAAALEDACASGVTSFDAGQSGGVVALQDFKRSMGASPRHVVDIRVEPQLVTRARRTGEGAKQAALSVLRRRSSGSGELAYRS
jgi:CelD/BcsL family acetyltransferase involved in cellulose biosynthesis